MLLWLGLCAVRTALSARARSSLCLTSPRLVSPCFSAASLPPLPSPPPGTALILRVHRIASDQIASLRRLSPFLASSPRLSR